MLKPSTIAVLVSLALTGQVYADEQLAEIKVSAAEPSNNPTKTTLKPEQLAPNATNLKTLLQHDLSVDVNNLQRTRAGNEGVNLRGLQGNRVGLSVDGIPLPEAQENKLFVTTGTAFGRGDFIETEALRSVEVNRSGSNSGLSGSVNFKTLEPADVLKDKALGGFAATAYNSVDTSTSATVGVAAQNERYQGLLLTNYRGGHETKTHGDVGGTGETRTEADPKRYKHGYVLVKNYYQVAPEHRIGLVFEHLQHKTDTDKLSGLTQSSSSTMLSDRIEDKVSRNRLSLSHLYEHDTLTVDSQLFYQLSKTNNWRQRLSTSPDRTIQTPVGAMFIPGTTTRLDQAENKDKLFGIQSAANQQIAANQTLRYGLSYTYQSLTNKQISTNATANTKPSADTKQHKLHLFVEDEILLGQFVLVPHLGLTDYRLKPSDKNGYVQLGSNYTAIQDQHKTVFLPKFSLQWQPIDAFQPYIQYSRGFKPASAQQLTTSFGGSYAISYALIGNPNLKPETANNFEAGISGSHERLRYRVAGYYNQYRNFIDYRLTTYRSGSSVNYIIQYDNVAKAKIYGVEAEADVQLWQALHLNAGMRYARGKATEQDGTKRPINSIQPLKLRVGLAYEQQDWGANIGLTHVRAKADKDIDGTMYNPSNSYNLVDLGAYWKPTANLTLRAGIDNLFNKKYWNWADLSYLAARNPMNLQAAGNAAYDSTVAINATNADAYSAPGRNFSVGLRYEF